MVDRNTDVVLVAGLPDVAMATKTLEHARELRQARSLTERDGSVGDLLNRIVPLLAHKIGVPIDGHERQVIMEYQAKPERRDDTSLKTVQDMSDTILDARREGKRIFGDSPLFSDPEKGNLAAVMLDRMLSRENIPQAMRPDGTSKPYPGPDGTTNHVVGVNGPEAVGMHSLATHMLEKTAAMGHHPMPYWSPGHLEAPHDPGRFGKMLSAESLLDIDAQRVYSTRLSKLPDEELAAELVEQARDMRARRPELDIAEQSGYHRFVTAYSIPEMGTLFGQKLQPEEINPHPIRRDDDQQMFEGVSSAIYHGIGEGQHYVVREGKRNPESDYPSLSEKVMFADATSGNSMGQLLDRVAVALDVERGGEYDRMGRALAEVGRYKGQGDTFAWTPAVDDEVSLRRSPKVEQPAELASEPEPAAKRATAKGTMAAAMASAGLVR